MAMPCGVVLVVDDEPMVRKYLSLILRARGFQLLEASNGSEGLAIVQQNDGRLDAIVSDVQMPGTDGIFLVRAIRERYPQIPCILVSGLVQIDSAVNVPFLRKPFTPAQLLHTLQRAMRESARVLEPSGGTAG